MCMSNCEHSWRPGFRITFVSNAPKFSEGTAREIASFCRQILWRHNVGYDFGAYKDGIKAIGIWIELTAYPDE